jgi:hypothetical protein
LVHPANGSSIDMDAGEFEKWWSERGAKPWVSTNPPPAPR